MVGVVPAFPTFQRLLPPFACLELFDALLRFRLLGRHHTVIGTIDTAAVLSCNRITGHLVRAAVEKTGFPQRLVDVLSGGLRRGDDLSSLLQPRPTGAVELRGGRWGRS